MVLRQVYAFAKICCRAAHRGRQHWPAQWPALLPEPPPKKALENKTKWMPQAEEAIKKVPFFVRKRVRARVEKEAMEAGKQTVSLADVKATQARYLTRMSSEIKGYQIETCFGQILAPADFEALTTRYKNKSR
jgi:hypothetical protein